MINCAILMGRLTADPELRNTPSGAAVTSFTLAVERAYVKSGEERQTDFIDIVAWRNTAEFICRYFSKGSMIAIQGSIQTRSYTDKEGNKRKGVDIVAEKASFCGESRNRTSDINQAEKPENEATEAKEINVKEEIENAAEDFMDDLPF